MAGASFGTASSTLRSVATPTGLLAAVEGSGVRLAWDASGADDLAGYVVYRAADASDTFTRVSESLVSSTSYLDGGLSLDTLYRYRVTAVDASGNESTGTTDVGVRSAVTS